MLISQMEKLGPREVKSLSAHTPLVRELGCSLTFGRVPTGLALWRDGPGEAE